VDPVPDPLLLRKSGSAGNRTWDLWICSHEPQRRSNSQTLQQIITETADEVTGERHESKESTENKNDAYYRMIKNTITRAAEEQYKELRRRERRTLRKKKTRFHEEQIKQDGNLHT
jgi:hypothetical protein